ncbi:MAG: N-acetylmuramoyl-L-alanine amidase [Nitrospirota bacterium]
MTWLASALRNAGLEVIEVDGWEQRGDPDIDVEGVVCHHTATGANWTDKSVARLLRDGRPDLPGPLSQLGLDRAGRFWLIAAGRCNHNGYGVWGNDSIGIEAFNDGRGEPWGAPILDAYARGCAAIARHLGLTVNEIRGHKETDPARKIDPTFDMDRLRLTISRHLNPPPPPVLPPEEPVLIKRKSNPNHALLYVGGLLFEAHGSTGEGPVVDDGVWNKIVTELGPVIPT